MTPMGILGSKNPTATILRHFIWSVNMISELKSNSNKNFKTIIVHNCC